MPRPTAKSLVYDRTQHFKLLPKPKPNTKNSPKPNRNRTLWQQFLNNTLSGAVSQIFHIITTFMILDFFLFHRFYFSAKKMFQSVVKNFKSNSFDKKCRCSVSVKSERYSAETEYSPNP